VKDDIVHGSWRWNEFHWYLSKLATKKMCVGKSLYTPF